MDTFFDQLRLAATAFLCGAGLMMTALYIAGLIGF